MGGMPDRFENLVKEIIWKGLQYCDKEGGEAVEEWENAVNRTGVEDKIKNYLAGLPKGKEILSDPLVKVLEVDGTRHILTVC
jgi:hypothetical protein